MVNAMDLALTEIHFSIPYKLLELTFKNPNFGYQISIDEAIMTQVIRARVLKHCNLVGGKYKEIILRPDFWVPTQPEKAALVQNIGQFSIYRIPPEERDFLPIVDVSEIEWPGVQNGYGMPYAGYYSGNSLGNAARKMLDAQTFRSTPPKPTVELLSGDLIRLNPSQHSNIQWVLNCRLEYDKDAINMNQAAAKVFAKLCVAAVKSYIYRQLIVTIDQAFIETGYEISVIKSLVEEYKDAEEKFEELLEEFAGAAKYDPLFAKKLIYHALQ